MAKEMISLAANYLLVPANSQIDGALLGHIEVAIVTSEPMYAFDESGMQTRQRKNDTLRFSTNAKGLRQMAEVFEQWASDLDELAARHRKHEEPNADPKKSKGPK